MKRANQLITAIFIAISLLAFPINSHAVDSNIFKYQLGIAKKGNAPAQFKVAAMYETGVGTTKNTKQAEHWYTQAANGGLSTAKDRLSYLKIKQHGYKKGSDSDWLNRVKAGSDKGDAEAMYLLAQLYRQGLGVKKDLNKSFVLLDQISVFDIPYVDSELELVRSEQNAKPKKIAVIKKPVVEASVIKKQAPAENQALATVNAQKLKVQQAEAKKLKAQQLHNEKVLRYKQAMLKLKQEQKIIDDLQASVDRESAGADEEF